ncbi:MAG: hypothetical protein NVS3B25_15300 [Hymenobacter sp.]
MNRNSGLGRLVPGSTGAATPALLGGEVVGQLPILPLEHLPVGPPTHVVLFLGNTEFSPRGWDWLTAGRWLLSAGAPRRRCVRFLNAYMRQHPATTFMLFSRFPGPHPAATAVRRLGGWLLRRQLTALPNCHWLDSHQLLRAEDTEFAEPSPFNKLAHGLAAALFQPKPEEPFCQPQGGRPKPSRSILAPQTAPNHG